ncbi:HAMP domain-containing sensor histidine kinase [Streptomyces sp. XD-27]|uniref:sensor histidine kinase n=1 Tax=Streptomyces sp. XD-27 TaxID=3062779 RepID=UPI0026F46C6F|nr:HAMP domain-containing sensor histidine kinase [Streptomyces sp. XD-27]WKX71367.1 HAMP domain-containing sensor histidine kinase [Streptomyces sp. XD-27]
MGLRTKTALVIAGTAAIVATLIGLLVHHRTAEDQRRNAARAADAQLQDALDDYAAGIDSGALVNPRGLPATLRETITRRPVRATYLQHPGGGRDPVMWAAARIDGDVLAVRRSYAEQTRALTDLDQVLLGSGAAATALGCGLGIAVAATAGRRIGASARTAQRIADGDLTARVEPKGKDEIARLGAAVNTMADALSARLEAERRVTADIAHELRTPVAGLVTAVGLLPPGRPAELVSGGVDVLRRLVEDVLEVARLDVPGVEQAQREAVRLSTLARRAAAAAGGDGGGSAGDVDATVRGDVDVTVRTDATVETDPRRVERILINLISNARRHGAAPVTLEVDGHAVSVRDHGPGFPADLLTEGPRRFRTGARERGTGIGLGLTIVEGQAQVLGARVTYENPPTGGARVTLDLAPDTGQGPHS